MDPFTRRLFLKNTAAAAGALGAAPLLLSGWHAPARAATTGYFESEFGMSDALYRRVLDRALSRGGDFADLYFEHSLSNWVELEDGRVDRAYGSVDLGVGIRTVKGDQTGYGFTQELTEQSMMNAAATAATIADGAGGRCAREFVRPRIADYYPLKKLLNEVPLTDKLPLVQGANEKCFQLSDLIIKVNAEFHDSQKRIMIVSSDGVKTEDLLPRNYLYASVIAEKDGVKERGAYNLGGRHDFSYYTQDVVNTIADEAVGRALVLFDAVQPPAGEMPVVLGPGVTGVLLHEAIGHGMEADFNRKKISTYCTMIGRKVAEPFVTIVDDAEIPAQLGSINVDDEGIPGKRTVLVQDGILVSYLHDKISARHYEIEPTGNGRRESFQHYPLPRMRNTYMLAGPAKPDEVIKSVDKGIYVQDVSNGQVKIGEGDFAFYVSQGRMIENGELTYPVKDINIMGNGPKMLANVIMVADDLELHKGGGGACGKGGQRIPVSFGLPTCLVKSMTVGGVQT